MALPILPLIAPAVAIGKGIASGIKSLGSKKTSVKSVVNKREEQVKNKISPSSLPSISPTYYEKPKEAQKSTPKTSGGSVKSVKMTAESIKSSLLNQDKLLKTLKSDNAKLEREELERQKREQAVNKIKSGLKSVGSKITAPFKKITGGVGKAVPLLLIGILVNSIQGIISGVRNFYNENIKPKVEFVNKKVKDFNDFLTGTESELTEIEGEKDKVNKEIKELKSITDGDEIEKNINKIKKVLNSNNKISGETEEEIIKNTRNQIKLVDPKMFNTPNEELVQNVSTINFDKSLGDTSFLYDSDFFDDNLQSYIVYQERIIEVEV